jgi:hypothetical protein
MSYTTENNKENNDKNNIVFYDSNDFNLENDLNNGQVYLIRNKINKKCYIGQAICFTGNNNNKWGTLGRWKSHIREALKTNQNNCCVLNNAIRKYGENNFEIFTLMKCSIEKLDENEINFIKIFDSMQPNGYNIKSGGYSSKNSDNTIEKMKIAHLGHRRDKYSRKYEEDNYLPKYIKMRRDNGIESSYAVTKFPIGIEKTEYIKDKYFSLNKFGSKENALKAAIEYLNELKKQYEYIEKEIFKEKSDIKPVLTLQNKKELSIQEKLSENIYPILEENKIKGYYVDGILDHNGIPYPKKIFTGKTNRWNLNSANIFINQLKHYRDNKINISNFDELDHSGKSNKNLHEKFHLPKYVNIFKRDDVIKGFVINGFPASDFKSGKYTKTFTNSKKTLEENYDECIKHLEEIKLNEPTNSKKYIVV